MSEKTQVGNVLQETDGTEFTVYTTRWGGEEISDIEINGRYTLNNFDPSAPGGRQLVRDFIARLAEALDAHAASVEEIYGQLKVGDTCTQIRLPEGDESRCTVTLRVDHGGLHSRLVQCSRAAHEDDHHVHVDDDYEVIAVHHATPVDTAMAAYEATLPAQPNDAVALLRMWP